MQLHCGTVDLYRFNDFLLTYLLAQIQRRLADRGADDSRASVTVRLIDFERSLLRRSL